MMMMDHLQTYTFIQNMIHLQTNMNPKQKYDMKNNTKPCA
jgi:hypothetical protein